jgi:hypothetical protein
MRVFKINIKKKDKRVFDAMNTCKKRLFLIHLQTARPLKQCTSFIRVLLCLFISLYASNSFAQTKAEKKKKPENSSVGFKRKSEANNSGDKEPKSSEVPKRTDMDIESVNSKTMQDQKLDAPRFNFDQLPTELQQKVNSNKGNGRPSLEGIVKAYRVELKNCENESDCKKALAFLNEERDFVSMAYREGSYVDLRVGASMKSEELKSLLLIRGLDFNFINEYYLLEATK